MVSFCHAGIIGKKCWDHWQDHAGIIDKNAGIIGKNAGIIGKNAGIIGKYAGIIGKIL